MTEPTEGQSAETPETPETPAETPETPAEAAPEAAAAPEEKKPEEIVSEAVELQKQGAESHHAPGTVALTAPGIWMQSKPLSFSLTFL